MSVKLSTLCSRTARGRDLPDERGNPGPAPSTDELADFARALMLRIDPDGAEPDDRRAEHNRALTIGRLRDGVRPVQGGLLPEVAGVLERLFDALNNPAAAADSPDLSRRAGSDSDPASGSGTSVGSDVSGGGRGDVRFCEPDDARSIRPSKAARPPRSTPAPGRSATTTTSPPS